MRDNVFSSLSKHLSAADENYLTETLVFVAELLLMRETPTGLGMVNLLCCPNGVKLFEDPKDVRISTQIATEGGTPDIQIEGENSLVFIEVKHDSPLMPNQLERYKEQLERSGTPKTRLVLLSRSRYSSIETTLQRCDYSRIYWYQIYNWLSGVDIEDAVSQYFVRSLMDFLEEKRMSMKKVGWEYIQGIPALLHLTDMLEAAITEIAPGAKFTRTAGWNWRGFYLPGDYWFGVRFAEPLTVVFEDNRGNHPVTYKQDLNLRDEHFFSLNKDEQFECLVKFLQRASEGVVEMSGDATAG